MIGLSMKGGDSECSGSIMRHGSTNQNINCTLIPTGTTMGGDAMEVRHAINLGGKWCLQCGCIQVFMQLNGQHPVCSHCLRCRDCGIVVLGRIVNDCEGQKTALCHN